MRNLLLTILAFLSALGAALSVPALPTLSVAEEQMSLNMERSKVVATPDGSAWDVTLCVSPDNAAKLKDARGVGFRQWWHARIDGLDPKRAETLNVRVIEAGYSDTILPVWSLDGGPYERTPIEATPKVTRFGRYRSHAFTLRPPKGTKSLRIAKFFPYTIRDKRDFLKRIGQDPRVTISVTGKSHEGRPIERIDITDPSAPGAGKKRVWIHAMVHPSETTGAFVVEGLVDFLLSDDPYAAVLLQNVDFNIVPMMNPDGVAAGNYRLNTNTTFNERGTNLEDEWEYPWKPREAEAIAIKDDIEGFMGTPDAPAANPIVLFFNLHSAGGDFPFHFLHQPFWKKPGDRGVNKEVHDLEKVWIELFKARSRFTRRGGESKSLLLRGDKRVFVEAMMFDRYSNNAAWRETKSPDGKMRKQSPVMAITYEGTYSRGPNWATGGKRREDWSTSDDYRINGAEMALAIADFLGLAPE